MSFSLSLASAVTICDGVTFRDLQGELVLLNLNSGLYFGLDPVGTRVWHWLREHRRLQTVLDLLLAEYDVPEAQGRRDLLALVSRLAEKGLVTITHDQVA